MSTPTVHPNRNGSLADKCEWVKRRQQRAKLPRNIPRLHISRADKNGSTLNKAATSVLTQEGEEFAYILVRDGKLILQPLPAEPGLVGMMWLRSRKESSGAHVTVPKEIFGMIGAAQGDDLVGTWDDTEGVMLFEVRKAAAK